MLRYEALSENGGLILDELDTPYILIHEDDDTITHRPINPGERPTILNREAAERFIKDGFNWVRPDHIATKEKPAPYHYRDAGQDVFTAEYHLYLAKELEKKEGKHKPTQPESKVLELTGFLPQEESPE